MRNTLSASLALAGAAVAVTCLGGCGSSLPAKTVTVTSPQAATAPSQPAASAPCPTGVAACVTTDPAVTVAGSQNLTQNLGAIVGRDYKQLSDVSLRCRNTTGFPKVCTITARWTLQSEPTVPVAGVLRVLGIYTRTDTYAFQLTYQQTGGPRLHKLPPSPRRS